MIEQPMFYLNFNTGLTERLSYSLISHYKETTTNTQKNYFVDTLRNVVGVSLSESNSFVIDNQFTFFQNNQLTWVTGLFIERSRQRASAVKLVPGTTDPNDRQQPVLNPEEDFDNMAGYLQLEWIPNENVYLVSGLRYIQTDAKYPSEFVPRLGFRYILSDSWQAKFNYQRGYRPPGVGEGQSRGVVAPNPDLTSETIDSFEISLVGKPLSYTGIRATYFESDISNLIGRTAYTGGGGFISITDNIGTTHVKGIELEANIEISAAFEIESTATYTDSINQATSQNTRTVVPYKLNISFIYQPVKKWELAWDNYIRYKPSTDSENALFQGKNADNWFLSNITLTNKSAFNIDDLDLMISIRNILNEAYGQVDPRPTTAPATPFLTSCHPQESRNIVLGINDHF